MRSTSEESHDFRRSYYGFPTLHLAVEKLSVTASGTQSGCKNACFGPLKPDLKPLGPACAAINVPGSRFSTG
jgi:hypothetical protein